MPTVLRLAAAAAALVLVGCASPSAGPETAAPGQTPAATTPTSAVPSAPASPSRSATSTTAPIPDTLKFTGTTVDGKPFDGASLTGKPVLLWFWAPWCPTCRSQTADVQAVARDYAGRVAVVGVGSLSEDDAPSRRFAAEASGPVPPRRPVRRGLPTLRGGSAELLRPPRCPGAEDLVGGVRRQRRPGRPGRGRRGLRCPRVCWHSRSAPGWSPRSTRAVSPCCRPTCPWSCSATASGAAAPPSGGRWPSPER